MKSSVITCTRVLFEREALSCCCLYEMCCMCTSMCTCTCIYMYILYMYTFMLCYFFWHTNAAKLFVLSVSQLFQIFVSEKLSSFSEFCGSDRDFLDSLGRLTVHVHVVHVQFVCKHDVNMICIIMFCCTHLRHLTRLHVSAACLINVHINYVSRRFPSMEWKTCTYWYTIMCCSCIMLSFQIPAVLQ